MAALCLFKCPCGKVRKTNGEWVLPRLSDEQLEAMCKRKGFDFKKVTVSCNQCYAKEVIRKSTASR